MDDRDASRPGPRARPRAGGCALDPPARARALAGPGATWPGPRRTPSPTIAPPSRPASAMVAPSGTRTSNTSRSYQRGERGADPHAVVTRAQPVVGRRAAARWVRRTDALEVGAAGGVARPSATRRGGSLPGSRRAPSQFYHLELHGRQVRRGRAARRIPRPATRARPRTGRRPMRPPSRLAKSHRDFVGGGRPSLEPVRLHGPSRCGHALRPRARRPGLVKGTCRPRGGSCDRRRASTVASKTVELPIGGRRRGDARSARRRARRPPTGPRP